MDKSGKPKVKKQPLEAESFSNPTKFQLPHYLMDSFKTLSVYNPGAVENNQFGTK